MKRTTKQLRSRTLDTGSLQKASGGRGTCCGNQTHCNACGHIDLTSKWATYQACPFCGCPTTMSARQYNGTGPASPPGSPIP